MNSQNFFFKLPSKIARFPNRGPAGVSAASVTCTHRCCANFDLAQPANGFIITRLSGLGRCRENMFGLLPRRLDPVVYTYVISFSVENFRTLSYNAASHEITP